MSPEKVLAPLVLIVSGPSGSGKSTLVQRLLQMPGTMASRSCTTRMRRATEASGKCYDFVTEAEFEAMVERGEFLEYARVFGKYSYGTPQKWLDESRARDLDLVLEIDVQGAAQVKEKLPESVAIFILPPAVARGIGTPVAQPRARFGRRDRPAAGAGPLRNRSLRPVLRFLRDESRRRSGRPRCGIDRHRGSLQQSQAARPGGGTSGIIWGERLK